MTPGLVWTASPLVSFQLTSADSRFTLRSMALSDPVWRAWTTATELTPAATPRTTLPKRPDVFPGLTEQVLPAADLQSACDRAVVENFSEVTGLRVRDKPTAGFRAQWGLPGDSTCLNLTPTPWKLARTRDRGTLQCGRRLDICSAMFEQRNTAPYKRTVCERRWLHTHAQCHDKHLRGFAFDINTKQPPIFSFVTWNCVPLPCAI